MKKLISPFLLLAFILPVGAWEISMGDSLAQDIATSVVLADDGGFVVTGMYNQEALFGPPAGPSIVYAVKFSVHGEIEWTYEGEEGSAFSVARGCDGGYLLTGVDAASGIVLKLNDYGELEWSAHPFGEDSQVVLCDVDKLPDNSGYVTVGLKVVDLDSILFLATYAVKLNPEGEIVWHTPLDSGYVSPWVALIFSAIPPSVLWHTTALSDGGMVASCLYIPSLSETSDAAGFIISRLSADGSIRWTTIWTDKGAAKTVELSDGNLLCVGNSHMTVINSEDGSTIEENLYDFPLNLLSVTPTLDGNLVAVGSYDVGVNPADSTDTLQNCALFKFSPDGDSIWLRIYDTYESSNGADVAQLADGGFAIAGWHETDYIYTDTSMGTSDTGSLPDWYIIKTNSDGFSDIKDYNLLDKPETIYLSVSPNPFNSSLSIWFSTYTAGDANVIITDLKGNIVKSWKIIMPAAETRQILWNADGLPSGLYLVRVSSAGKTLTKRALLIK